MHQIDLVRDVNATSMKALGDRPRMPVRRNELKSAGGAQVRDEPQVGEGVARAGRAMAGTSVALGLMSALPPRDRRGTP